MRTLQRRLSLAVLALVATIVAARASAAPQLGGHGADLTETSVSGISSGGYMAAQFLFKSGDRGSSWRKISPDLTLNADRDTLKMMGKVVVK